MVDLTLLDPMLAEEQVAAMCERARRYGLACVTVRASDAQLASKWLVETVCGSFVGGDGGSGTTAAKLYEIRDLLGRGVREFSTVINLGKLVSRQFQYIELELLQMAQQCKESGAKLKVTLEFPQLAQDLRVIGSKILKRAEVHLGRASSSAAVSDDDLKDLAARFGEVVQLDAGGNVTTLDEARRLYRLGCVRFTSRDPWLMLEAWKRELAEKAKLAAAPTS